MRRNEDLYKKYDLLLPSMFEGGYLIISLYEKIQNKQIEEHFSTDDIKIILEEIATTYDQGIAHSERIIKNLLHYFLRSVPNEYGKFYLTDHAKRLVELMIYKLENPYKNYPLKESFDKYFVIRTDIKTISDLELRFGREFVSGYKRVINDHLESLEDELSNSYSQLNIILHSDEKDATLMVKKFVDVFRKFGDRAEDITNAISSKDNFLRKLRIKVDDFYDQSNSYKHPETEEEKKTLSKLQDDWRTANNIYNDLDAFFKTVDIKIGHIRKQILNASGKLTELHETFSTKSNFRLLIKRLFHLALDCASNNKRAITLCRAFPLKEIVFEKPQLFYPEYYDFKITQNNTVINIERDAKYELQQKVQIEREIKRQEIINSWISTGKQLLEDKKYLQIVDLMNDIIKEESDFTIAQNVAIELTQYISERNEYQLEIKQHPILLIDNNLLIWKMNIKKLAITNF